MLAERTASPSRHTLSALGAVAVLLLAPAAGAGDAYPVPSFFLDGVKAEAPWRDILGKPAIKAEFPFVGFETTFVPLESVCVDGPMLAIADPRLDTGVRVSADGLKAQVEAAAAAEYVAEPRGRLAAATPAGPSPPVAMRYPVKVNRIIERGLLRQHIFLFEKLWPIPTCSPR